ncbi:MAG: methyltransferase type 12 [Leptolyngbya sp. LCM1.Bin17]|nr:MAG: methyltransferase type 12 [Leptolyngbya sp. LCM1.Bin17]
MNFMNKQTWQDILKYKIKDLFKLNSLEEQKNFLEASIQAQSDALKSLDQKNRVASQNNTNGLNATRNNSSASLPPVYDEEVRNTIKFVDGLNNDDLAELNNLLNWNCFVVDGQGRRFGDSASATKRYTPHQIPDRRIVIMNEVFDLADKHVLEIGCFEGVHTIGLSMYAKKVTAFDSRIENVVKTIVRCALFGYHPTVFQYNTENPAPNLNWLIADVMHHVGVLYHLKDPVQHLLNLDTYIGQGIMLDTHYALDQDATQEYTVDGQTYAYKHYVEGGDRDPFSGMYDFARWLRLDDIAAVLAMAGFPRVDIVEKRNERNGPRVLLMAQRS